MTDIPSNPALDHITALTREYAAAYHHLRSTLEALEETVRAVRKAHLDELRAATEAAGTVKATLHEALVEHPELFAGKRRTLTIEGIRIGWRKLKGKVVLHDEAATIARIREKVPTEQAELLIRVKETVHKPAVADLTAGDLKRLGIAIEEDSDEVVIKSIDSAMDKLLAALLAEYTEALQDTAEGVA